MPGSFCLSSPQKPSKEGGKILPKKIALLNYNLLGCIWQGKEEAGDLKLNGKKWSIYYVVMILQGGAKPLSFISHNSMGPFIAQEEVQERMQNCDNREASRWSCFHAGELPKKLV